MDNIGIKTQKKDKQNQKPQLRKIGHMNNTDPPQTGVNSGVTCKEHFVRTELFFYCFYSVQNKSCPFRKQSYRLYMDVGWLNFYETKICVVGPLSYRRLSLDVDIYQMNLQIEKFISGNVANVIHFHPV